MGHPANWRVVEVYLQSKILKPYPKGGVLLTKIVVVPLIEIGAALRSSDCVRF